jgi:hypothetical protein
VTWHEDRAGQHYTLTDGNCMAIVTRSPAQVWVAQLVRMGVAIEHDSFQSLSDAQTWSQTHLAELKVGCQCI